MQVQTTRFGLVQIDESEIITLSRGLVGFPDKTRFTLIDHSPGSPFQWLQSVEEPGLAFLVTDPYRFFPDYEVDLPGERAKQLQIQKPEDAQVLTMVTVRATPKQITANLLGPLVVGMNSHRAEQLILDGDRYNTRHPLS